MTRVVVVEGVVAELARHVVENAKLVRVKVSDYRQAVPLSQGARLNIYIPEREAHELGLRLGTRARVVLEVGE